MALNLFGFKFGKNQEEQIVPSVIDPETDDGTTIASSAAAYYGYYVDMDGTVKDEVQAIGKYREISLYPDVDIAIQDIVNEAIPYEEESSLVEIVLDRVEVSDDVKEIITDEFNNVLSLLSFNEKAPDIFRRWYVDGRLYYNVLPDANPRNGIGEVRPIESTKIKKVVELTKTKTPEGVDIVQSKMEYYVYSPAGFTGTTQQQTQGQSTTTNGVKMSNDSVVYIPSGFTDQNTGAVLSYLQKAIRPANQLRMLEDSLVIYRYARAPERRVFYIDVGNLPKAKAEQYVKDIMNRYRNKLVYDAKTGVIKDDKKHMCLAMNTLVPLLDGRTISIAQIAAEKAEGKTLWAYSCDPETGKFAPGLISWAGETRKNAQVMRLTLDNGKTITCTPDHKFPVWNKGFVRADELIVGESMIPNYTRKSKIVSTAKKENYEQFFDNETKKWTFTHRAVSKWKDENSIENEYVFNEEFIDDKKITVHHKNINSFDNSPENLVRMNSADHLSMHSTVGRQGGRIGGRVCKENGLGYFNKNHPEYRDWHVNAGKIGGRISSDTGKSQENWKEGRKILADLLDDSEWNSWFREQQRKGWTSEKREKLSEHAKRNGLGHSGGGAALREYFKDKKSKVSINHRKLYRTDYPNSIIEFVMSCAQQQMTCKDIVVLINDSFEMISDFIEINSSKVMGKQKDYSKLNEDDIYRIAKETGVNNYTQLKEAMRFRNHKITKIEFLEERMDTGCITIDGDEIYHNYHTFALDAGIYTKNSMLEDFFLPRRDNSKGTEITTLPGSQNLNQTDDIEYFQHKLYTALNVPISRMMPETGFSLGRSTEITRDEVKFQKFVSRIRRKFSELFFDLLRIQLTLKGVIDLDEWDEIKELISFRFQKDNFFAELKNQEIFQQRMMIAQQAEMLLGKYVSAEYISRNIFKFNDEEIADIAKQNEQEYSQNPWWFPARTAYDQGMMQMNMQQEMQQQQMQQMQGQEMQQDQNY